MIFSFIFLFTFFVPLAPLSWLLLRRLLETSKIQEIVRLFRVFFGNFLGQGYEVGSGRDWARLGNLYLQDGVWNGERILPEGYAKFVSTLAPAWEADKRPVYGAFFWINGTGTFPVVLLMLMS